MSFWVSTEFNETRPGGYRLNRLLIVDGTKVNVCDPDTHSVAEIELSQSVQDSLSRIYRQIEAAEFIDRFFNFKDAT